MPAFLDPAPFLGTRGTLARLRDARIFHTWVENLDAREFTGRVTSEKCPEVGDELVGEIFGIGATAAFRMKVHTVIDPTRFGALGQDQGLMFIADLTATPKMSAASPNARLAVQNVVASMSDQPFIMEVLDVSSEGLALIMPIDLEKGQTISLVVQTAYGEVSLRGEVRNMRDLGARGTRTGFQIVEIDRTGRPRWNQFFRR